MAADLKKWKAGLTTGDLQLLLDAVRNVWDPIPPHLAATMAARDATTLQYNTGLWREAIRLLVKRLIEKHLDLKVLSQRTQFTPGDHSIIDMVPNLYSKQIHAIRKQFDSAGNPPFLFVTVVFCLGTALGQSLLDALQKTDGAPVFVSPERDIETGERDFKRRRTARSDDDDDFPTWRLPPDESLARLEGIPEDLLSFLLTDAPLRELVKIRKINRQFKGYIDNGEFWRALVLRDFPMYTKDIQAVEVAPISSGKGFIVPLSIAESGIANSAARAVFFNIVQLTADLFVNAFETVQKLLLDVAFDPSYNINVSLRVGSNQLEWHQGPSDPEPGHWAETSLCLDRSNNMTSNEFYVKSGQERGCVEKYEALLHHYEQMLHPWFDPTKENALLRTFFREILLKTDYLNIVLKVDFSGCEMDITPDIFIQNSPLPLRLVFKSMKEELAEDFHFDEVAISPVLAGIILCKEMDHSENIVFLSCL